MKRVAIALTLAALLVTAGCTSTGSSQTSTSAPTPTPTTTETPTTATTSEDRVSMERGHPFGGETIQVYVTDSSGYAINTTQSVEVALDYWNEYSEEYGRYNASYELTDSRGEAEIVVEFVGDVECGWLPDTRRESLGCAPLINPYERFEDGEHATVRIHAGTGGTERVQIIKHEFGHTLGLTHGMEPMPLMSETI